MKSTHFYSRYWALCALIGAIMCSTTAFAADGGNTVDSSIIITRKGSIEAVKGSDQTFVGNVNVEFSVPQRGDSRLSGGLVSFQPGARCNWHTHPYGQLLIIVEGKGRVGEWGKAVQEVAAGDLVWFPAGVKHWHGGASDQLMRHYAIQEEKDGSAANWMEKVSDEHYNGR